MKVLNRRVVGFTLLEVMVAMSIIAIVITAVFKLQSQTIIMSNEARFYTTAPLLAQKVMAEYDRNPHGNLSDSGDFGESFEGYGWTRTVEDFEFETLEEDVEGLKKIDVVVSFNDAKLDYNIRTFRFVQEKED